MDNNNTVQQNELTNTEQYLHLLNRMLQRWYLFVVILAVSLAIGWYFSQSRPRVYKNTLLMLFPDTENKNSSSRDMVQFEMFDAQQTIDDNMAVIRSSPIVRRTLEKMDVKVSYFVEQGMTTKDVYTSCPFHVVVDTANYQPVFLDFELNIISNNQFKLIAKSEKGIETTHYSNEKMGYEGPVDISQTYNFGDDIVIHNKPRFKIIYKHEASAESFIGKNFSFRFNSMEYLTKMYKESLSVIRDNKKSTLITLEVQGGSTVMITEFLNTLADVFLAQNLEKKNRKAKMTIDFIENQLKAVADTLGHTSKQLEDFRSINKVMDINFLSQSLDNQMRDLKREKEILGVKELYYKSIEKYFKGNGSLDDLIAPSAMGVDDDPQLVSLITELTQLNSERSYYVDNKNFENPNLKMLNTKIGNLKRTIGENIKYLRQLSGIATQDINLRIESLEERVKSLPTIEKKLRYIERDFDINEDVYTYLLKKHSEAQIAEASNFSDYEIVEKAKSSGAKQVSPKNQMIYFSAFFLGLLIPGGIIFLSVQLDSSIQDKREIENISTYPVIGALANNVRRSQVPVMSHPDSLITDSFRAIRTSLGYLEDTKGKNTTIMVSSTMKSDGKTFVAMNLAMSFAIYGKKTLLLDFDFRRPSISKYIDLNYIAGLSNYLNGQAKLEDIIVKHPKIDNLDIINVQPQGINIELMASDITKNLFSAIKNHYDYIIVDSSSVGVYPDSYTIMHYADIVLFPVRLYNTNKKHFAAVIKDFNQKKIKNIAVVVNGDDMRNLASNYNTGNLSALKKLLESFYNKVKNLAKPKRRLIK